MPTPGAEQLAGRLRGLLEPVVAGAGLEIDAVDVRAAGRKHTVRIVVDLPDEPAEASGGCAPGVGLDDIARLSRAAAAELDRHEHLIEGSYTLEVTSPGVDRPLTRPAHWRRAHLRLVRVRLREGETLDVRVGRAGPEAVTVLPAVAQRGAAPRPALRELRYADVAHAVVQVEFKAPPEAEVELLTAGSANAGPGGGAAHEDASGGGREAGHGQSDSGHSGSGQSGRGPRGPREEQA